ncbi:MAG: translocation/assembly module TamB domain-containing protein, partial [Vicingaceae bacterium]
MTIDVKVKTEKNTTLNIPLTDNVDLVENDFIEFISNDSMNTAIKDEVDLSNIEMNFDLEITPEAQVRLVFDDQIGDVMRSAGSGDLNLEITRDGDLTIFGDYLIKDGDYLFTLQNVINKRFDLEEGGTIS